MPMDACWPRRWTGAVGTWLLPWCLQPQWGRLKSLRATWWLEVGITERLFHLHGWHLSGADWKIRRAYRNAYVGLLHVAWPPASILVSGLKEFLHWCLGHEHGTFPKAFHLVLEIIWPHFHCMLLTKVVTSPSRFKCRGHRPHISMGGVSKNLWPFVKTTIMGLVVWPIDS